METWKDKYYGFLDYGDFSNNYSDDKCADNEVCQSNFDELVKNKRRFQDIDELPLKSNINDKKSGRVATYYHSSRPMSCSCGIDFRILDLGHQYYPRFLHTGVCKTDICGGMYRCLEKYYKVRVLKQRDPRSPEIKTSVAFPDNLKGTWQPEMVNVTVACECSL
ncbi:hypothetical protein Zmor_000153 [Zophobas morio]|uniref:Prothoracicotropic hormone n=2 Tax=Zophobas TaxID=7073 RepID=A0AA38MRH1_9CUCU|nr:hypothetical protein Zmor_000153 [Zophobas morio]